MMWGRNGYSLQGLEWNEVLSYCHMYLLVNLMQYTHFSQSVSTVIMPLLASKILCISCIFVSVNNSDRTFIFRLQLLHIWVRMVADEFSWSFDSDGLEASIFEAKASDL